MHAGGGKYYYLVGRDNSTGVNPVFYAYRTLHHRILWGSESFTYKRDLQESLILLDERFAEVMLLPVSDRSRPLQMISQWQ